MRFRKSLAAIAATAALALVASGCSAGKDGGDDDSTLTIAVTNVVQQWDPHKADWGTFLQPLQAAYDSLTHKNADGSFAPGLALEWEYTTPTTFEMKLRENVTFSDGEPFNADAVKANLDDAKGQDGPKVPQLAGFTSVEVTGEYAVKITTDAPDPSLPLIFSQVEGMMVSPKALKDPASLAQQPVGAGPYTLDSKNTLANDHYTFVKNDKYWNADEVDFKTIVFRVIPDSTAALNALRSGQVDMAGGAYEDKDTMEAAGFQTLEWLGYFQGMSLKGRMSDQVPALKDVRVRQAINYALDRDELQKILGGGQPTAQLFPPGTEGYDASLDKFYTHDVAKAKKLLADAGYADGIDLTVTSVDLPLFGRYFQVIQTQLAEANIRLSINNVQLSEYFVAMFSTSDPVFAWYYNVVDTYYDAKSILMPNGGFNPYKVDDPEIVRLFTEAAAAEPEKRAKIFKELSAYTVENAVHAITNFGNIYYYVDSDKVDVSAPFLEAVPLIYDIKAAK